MAKKGTGRTGESGSGNAWKALTPEERFLVLLNHYIEVDVLSQATGIPSRSIRSVFNAMLNGKNTPKLHSDQYLEGFQHARRRMTDVLRRRAQAANRGQYIAPLARTNVSLIQPQRKQIELTQYDRRTRESRTYDVESNWVSYYVEHLSLDEIIKVACDLYEVFRDTEQFNAFRFEFIARADEYMRGSEVNGRVGRKSWRDRSLAHQAEMYEMVLLSTETIPLAEFDGRVNLFEDQIRDRWQTLKLKGAVRITELYWTKFANYERPMHESRLYYEKMKARRDKNKGQNRKRGK